MEYILITDKWICGPGEGFPPDGIPNGLGRGCSSLLNDEGYMCCLGQFSGQAGALRSEIRNLVYPTSLSNKAKDRMKGTNHEWLVMDSVQVAKCAEINDNPGTTVAEKIRLLKEILASDGHTLKVIGTAHLPKQESA